MAGSISPNGVIWVAGEATGVSELGEYLEALPADIQTSPAATQTELDALEARILASGILPSVTF